MNKVNITDKGILEYYGNRVGFVKNDTAYVDEMFRKKDIEEFLAGENGLNIEWRNDIVPSQQKWTQKSIKKRNES